MRDVDLYLINKKLDLILAYCRSIIAKENQALTDFSSITSAITNEETVEGSVVTLLQQLSQQLQANANDPAQVQAIAQQITTDATNLAQAVQANTPADPNAPPVDPNAPPASGSRGGSGQGHGR
jgi:hypothetical protein